MPKLDEERKKANILNDQGRDTLDEFKGAEKHAKRASLREREASQKGDRAKTKRAAAAGRAANLAGAKDAYKAAREFNKMRKEGLSKEGVSAARRAATAAAWTALDQGSKAIAAETLGLSVVAYQALRHWKITIAIIILLFLFFFMMFDTTVFDPPPQDNLPTTSETCNPPKASFGQTSVCTITVTYNGSAQNIVITSTILPGTTFVSAGQKGTYDKTANTVTWDANQLNLPLNPVNITVTVTVRVSTQQNNTTVYNAYDINPTGLTSGSSTGGGAIPGNLPPSTNNCSGIYSYYMSITPGHQNYGDPTCTLIKKDPNGTAIINKDAILAELKTLKPSEAMAWFICVIPNESSYNANAYLAASTSGFGAYGLVQMNPTGKGSSKFDDGQVVWPLQLSNGIHYNDAGGHHFSYWPTSYDPCITSHGVTVN